MNINTSFCELNLCGSNMSFDHYSHLIDAVGNLSRPPKLESLLKHILENGAKPEC